MEKTCFSSEVKNLGRIQARHVLAMLVFLGFFSNYMLRVNLSIAIVAMVKYGNTSNQTTVESECEVQPGNLSIRSARKQTGDFEWGEYTQGLILGSFFWGYFFTQVLGGRLAELYGTKRVFGYSMLVTSLLTLVIPVAANVSYVFLIVVRVLQGLFEGTTWPSMHPMVSRWIPPHERSRFVTTYFGSQIGVVVTFPLCGLIIDSLGWEAVFYITGSLPVIWFICWWMLVYDTPDSHPRISQEEKAYIREHMGNCSMDEKPPPVPWKSAFTSMPYWAVVVADFGNNWGIYTLITQAPTYMTTILGFSIKDSGFLSSLPSLLRFLGALGFSCIADYILTHHHLSVSNTRKLFTCISHYLAAAGLLALGYSGCNHSLAVAILAMSFGLNGAVTSGIITNILDIAPNYSGSLYGVCNMITTIPGFLAPFIVGVLTNNNQTLAQWREVFGIATGLYCFTCTFFLIFGRGEVQPWNYYFKKKSSVEEEESLREITSEGETENEEEKETVMR